MVIYCNLLSYLTLVIPFNSFAAGKGVAACRTRMRSNCCRGKATVRRTRLWQARPEEAPAPATGAKQP